MIWLAGAVIFFVGLMLSIALHELGHLSFAKLFGVRTTQYMVGFGGTIWSFRRGETEYGVKWIPFGGYIRMIGMLPPRKEDAPGHVRKLTTGPFQGLIDSARGAALEEVRPTDGNRVFYSKPWWQKVLIMVGGPAMNLLLAAIFFAIVLMGFGTFEAKTTVSAVNACVLPANVQPDCKGPPAGEDGGGRQGRLRRRTRPDRAGRHRGRQPHRRRDRLRPGPHHGQDRGVPRPAGLVQLRGRHVQPGPAAAAGRRAHRGSAVGGRQAGSRVDHPPSRPRPRRCGQGAAAGVRHGRDPGRDGGPAGLRRPGQSDQ